MSSSDSAQQVNSVLSAYGMPMISNEGKFTSSYVKLDDGEQSTICAFAYPANWVETKRGGFMTAANYQTGDSLVFNVGTAGKAKAIGDLRTLDIVADATPSEGVAKVKSSLGHLTLGMRVQLSYYSPTDSVIMGK